MKMQMGKGVGQWQQFGQRLTDDPVVRPLLGLAVSFLGGFCLSAARLGNVVQPFCLAVLCAGLTGWLPMAFALGSSLGYWFFWGQEGLQGIFWVAAALSVCVLTGSRQQKMPLLMPSLGAMIVAVSGLIFQLWQAEQTSIALYLMRIGLAFGTVCLGQDLRRRRETVTEGLALGLGVLALAQIAPLPFLNLGVAAAAGVAALASFPAAALAGLALDLAGVVSVPMTAVLCLAFFVRLVPFLPRRVKMLLPALAYLVVMGLCGQSQWLPLPPLLLGGMAALIRPGERKLSEENDAQVYVQTRLETMAAVLSQSGWLLQQGNLRPVDERALITRAADRACGGCPLRKDCAAAEQAVFLPQALLHQSAITPENMPLSCKKKERLLQQLQQGQDLYRLLQADRRRQQEYRTALFQQYGFLAEYLRKMAEDLPRRQQRRSAKFQPETAVCSRGREMINGDRCFRFPVGDDRYYLLLCDGMGTGEGAAYEARLAGNLLRRMLVAGYSAGSAVESLNSLCALRSSAGAVTVDLAEADLVTGRVTVYKWGAAPSWLLHSQKVEQVGQACPPPGISLEEGMQRVDSIFLQNGEVLLMLSDGVDGETAISALEGDYDQPAGFLAALVLENGITEVPDDATAAVLRLNRLEN